MTVLQASRCLFKLKLIKLTMDVRRGNVYMLLAWGTLVQEPQQRHRELIVVERVASRHNGK